MEDTYAYTRAMALAGEKGKLMGAIGFALKYGGEMSNDVFRSLARTYIEVAGDDSWHVDDIIQVRTEAARRGVDIG